MDEKIDSKELGDSKKGGLNAKIFILGLPLFIIQLVAVYFITANILLVRFHTQPTVSEDEQGTEEVQKAKKKKKKKKEGEATGQFIFKVEDVIINPAGTSGQKLMLASIGFSVETEEEKKMMETQDAIVKDIVINTLSGKTLQELSQIGYKDTLKVLLMNKMAEQLPDLEVSNVYFSKYVFQ